MPELRRDPTSRSWVIIATERSRRPSDYRIAREPRDERRADACPFCYGNEHMTPPEVFALARGARAPNEPGWSVRVVPNKFPALSPGAGPTAATSVTSATPVTPVTAPTSPPTADDLDASMYARAPAVGAHEVLIESPDHDATFGTHPQEQMEDVLKALVARFRALVRDERLKYLQVFKNWGRTGGASLEHTHCQLIATPAVPGVVQEELDAASEHRERSGRCLYCDLIATEAGSGERVVESSERFLVFCPYASRFPYETWIVPTEHGAAFEDMSRAQIVELARTIRRTVRRLELAFEDPPYNLVWHTAPWTGDFGAYYHWHLELLPRLAIPAGFELGTGYYINPTAPEAAAATLRKHEPDEADAVGPTAGGVGRGAGEGV